MRGLGRGLMSRHPNTGRQCRLQGSWMNRKGLDGNRANSEEQIDRAFGVTGPAAYRYLQMRFCLVDRSDTATVARKAA